MAGDVYGTGGVLVVDQRPAAEHVVEHAEDGLFVSGNDAGGEDDGVVFIDRDEAMIVDGDARHGGHGLGLAAASQYDQALGVEVADVLRANDHAVGDAQVLERVRDFDVVDHAATDESYLAADARGDVDDLLNAVDGGCEARQHYATGGGAAEIFEARNY